MKKSFKLLAIVMLAAPYSIIGSEQPILSSQTKKELLKTSLDFIAKSQEITRTNLELDRQMTRFIPASFCEYLCFSYCLKSTIEQVQNISTNQRLTAESLLTQASDSLKIIENIERMERN